MKKSLIVLSILLLSVSLMAQLRTGTIWGHVTDTQGAPLPGVTVTLISPYAAPFTAVTDEQGIFRFPNLEPGSKYGLTAELQGFKKQEKTGVIVTIGSQSKIDLAMEQGKLEEQVTVVAVTPTVDAKKTTVGKNVSQEILQGLPSSRDPWNVMQMAPAIIMDRENVGGSESGQQASYYSKGDASGGANNIWALDGVVVTDPAAIGGSPIYWDFDSFEEMTISTGGSDVTVQTGGIALNMVTRRGGNKVSFGGRFYLTDNWFQADNLTAALKAQGVIATNKITYIKDYGFNLGGPIIKDMLWLWGSYGVQDISSFAITGALVKPTLEDYTAKLNAQIIPSNKFEAMWMAGQKKFIGRSASQSLPGGVDQGCPFHWGSPIVKLQDEQMVGSDLLISAKFAYMNAAFDLLPHDDNAYVKLATYDQTKAAWTQSYSYYITTRPMYDLDAHIQYYNDSMFGVSQEIKLGVSYSTRRVTTDSSYPGNLRKYINLTAADIDPTGTNHPVKTAGMVRFNVNTQYNLDWGVKQLAGFFQDTITTGRFNILVGARYDHQTPSINASAYSTILSSNPAWSIFDAASISALTAFMPPVNVPNITPSYAWNLLSPRLGITYDLFGTGKTVLKLSGAMYGDFMGTGSAAYLWNPLGTGGAMNFYWLDGYGGNPKDGKVESGELLFRHPSTKAPLPLIVGGSINPLYISLTEFQSIGWNGGFTPYSGAPQPSPYTVDSNAGSSQTWELLATVDHELLPDFSVGLNATYRKYDHYSWDANYYTNGPAGDFRINGQDVIQGPGSYVVAGQVPSVPGIDMGAGAGRNYYLATDAYTGTPYGIHTTNTNYNTFWGVDLTFNKRLSNKWMFDGSLSYMDQKAHYGNGYTDPTGLWALQDQVWAPNLGGASGKIGQYVFSNWMVKFEGLYQLPLGFDVSFTFNARAGHLIPHYMGIYNYGWSNTSVQSTTAWLDVFGTTKLPTFYQLNLRVQKMVKLFDVGRIYIMADFFNVLNSAIINRRYDKYEGDLEIYPDGSTVFTPYSLNYVVNEILNPFVARFGVRFQF